MSQQNPYAIHDDAMAVINAPADARAIFLQKTYSLMLAAVAVFVSTLWGTAHITPLANMADSLWNISPWTSLILFMGGAIAVHALAGTRIGIFVFFGFAFLWGLISAPLILYAAGTENGPAVIGQAAIITASIFIGLTAYVFKSGRDFGFLGGLLFTVMIGMIGFAIAGWIFNFSMGNWFCYLGAILFAGFILYDTSNIMRRYPATAHVSAAMVLFVDVIIMFKYLLLILMNRN
jgi:FtsH-binding integral membrane protein